jgi:site-specific DNA recombinase
MTTATAAERAARRWAVPAVLPDTDPEDRPLRTSIYARQSKGKPKSIAEQLACGDDRLDRQGWVLAARLSEGVSASRHARSARDEWPKILGMVQAGELDCVWLWESSRGDRDQAPWAAFLAACRDHGVYIWVETDRRLYDLAAPRDMKTLSEDGTDNAYESEKIAYRTNRAKDAARRDGALHTVLGGPPVVGYRYAADGETWEPDHRADGEPGQVAVLRDVAARMLRGVPLAVAFRAQPEVRTAPSPAWPDGRVINEKMIRAALQRPATAGLMTDRDGRVIGQVVDDPPLDIDTFKALEQVFARNRRLRGGRAVTAGYPLGKLLRCGKCGNQLTGSVVSYRGTKTSYYRCGNPHPRIGVAKPCKGVSVPAEQVHELIYSAGTAWWAEMPNWIAEETVCDEPAGPDDYQAGLAGRITQLMEWIADARASRNRGDISQSRYDEEAEELRWQLDQAREELAEARRAQRLPKRVQRISPPDWPALPAAEQCSLIATMFVTPIKVAPGNGGARALTAADRITLTPR